MGSGHRPRVFGMIVDALILAGGRSSRLGASGKQKLRIEGVTLLDRSVSAVRAAGARDVVVVGDDTVEGARTVRERPAFAGPAAAIAAGLDGLGDDADLVLVLACDMPRVAELIPPLLAAGPRGGIAVDAGRRQYLAFAAPPASLDAAIEGVPSLVDAPVRLLVGALELPDVDVPAGSSDDIDTWDDAARFGAVPTEATA